jgi:hypothetical protein
MSGSNLKNFPNILSDTLSLNNPSIYDVDLTDNDVFSQMFYYSIDSINYGGINVYPGPDEPEIIYFSFTYSKLSNRVAARNLLENSISNLTNYYIGIDKNASIITNEVRLYAYPNPFNSSIIIEIIIPYNQKNSFDIKLYNSAGEICGIIEDNKYFSGGNHKLNLSAVKYSSGIYYIRLTDNKNYSISKKIILIK